MNFVASYRHVVPELMDAPTLPEPEHHRALAGLGRINKLSRTAFTFLNPILTIARRNQLSELTLLDVACGGGDVPITLASHARRHGLTLHLTLFDRSPIALQRAATLAQNARISAATIPADATDALPAGPFDIITNSLFLHHLTARQVLILLAEMRQRTRRLLLISDLRRSRLGLATAHLVCRILTRSPIVHHDGPASVRAAFTLPELRDIATSAGLTTATLQKTFPFRTLLTWLPPERISPSPSSAAEGQRV